jgi:hypothetical protein
LLIVFVLSLAASTSLILLYLIPKMFPDPALGMRDLTSKENINVYNPFTGDMKHYAGRQNGTGKPIWVEKVQAVAYSIDVDRHSELWISYGDGLDEQISPNIIAISLSSDGGNRLVFSLPNMGIAPFIWDADTKVINSSQPNLSNVDINQYRKPYPYEPSPGNLFASYQNPKNSTIAIMGYGITILADLSTGPICEINLKKENDYPATAEYAQWSPDGQYLAMITISGLFGELATHSKVTIWDAATGRLIEPDLQVPFILDLTWSPDNRTLAVLGLGLDELKAGKSMFRKLFLVDVTSTKHRSLFPDRFFGGGANEGEQLSWSPDNHWIAVKCPLIPSHYNRISEDRICLIAVNPAK